MLSFLVPKVRSCKDLLGAQSVSNALYGMRRMNTDSAEVRAMLLVLTSKVESCRETFDAQTIGIYMYIYMHIHIYVYKCI
jgi:hypothetical protein